ncbi:hypothetical protein KUCAC02_032375 [Chaenocephalus aceratus]|nr:hypothetical protein KUCAC02_032375 [Chaenocephalus aceratus]
MGDAQSAEERSGDARDDEQGTGDKVSDHHSLTLCCAAAEPPHRRVHLLRARACVKAARKRGLRLLERLLRSTLHSLLSAVFSMCFIDAEGKVCRVKTSPLRDLGGPGTPGSLSHRRVALQQIT